MSRSYGITEWREDLKTILKKAGSGESHIVFLFSDTQVDDFLLISVYVQLFLIFLLLGRICCSFMFDVTVLHLFQKQ